MENLKFFKVLREYNIIENSTSDELIEEFILQKKAFYCGFDPTGKSLHLGHYCQILIAKYLVHCGMKAIFVIGGATGAIGDPSGKNKERVLLSNEIIINNTKHISKQLQTLLPSAKIINNIEWWDKIEVISFFRDCGKFFNISMMINRQFISNRIKTGLSYTEFSYLLLQSYDFYYLYKNHNCNMQFGGSDQWGNIVAGMNFIEKKSYPKKNLSAGFTTKLLTTKNNQKFGKTENNAIFFSSSLTKPYDMYQYLISIDDVIAKKLFYFCILDTNIASTKINYLISETSIKKRLLHKFISQKIISDIHGNEIAKDLNNISTDLFKMTNLEFKSKYNLQKIEKYITVVKINYSMTVTVFDLIAKVLNLSKSEIKRLIIQNGTKINNVTITNSISSKKITECSFLSKELNILKRGKQNRKLFKF